MFLPDKRFCTLEYLKAIMAGKKAYFKNSEVRQVNIPRYKSLALKVVFDMAVNRSDMRKYLPD